MEKTTPLSTMESWGKLARWWAETGAQDRVDIRLPRGVRRPGRKVRTVLLHDATIPTRYLRPSRSALPDFNSSACILLHSRATRTEELRHLCRHGWGLEYWSDIVVKHSRFEPEMLVPIVLRHLSRWGWTPDKEKYGPHLAGSSRGLAVVAHLETSPANHWRWRGAQDVEGCHEASEPLVALGADLLALPEDGWEIYLQLTADEGGARTWERARELAQVAHDLTREPAPTGAKETAEDESWMLPLLLGW